MPVEADTPKRCAARPLPTRLRPYRPEDCAATARLFHGTVHTVNARDYTPEQLAVWAPTGRDLTAWDRSLREHHALVAVLADDTALILDTFDAGVGPVPSTVVEAGVRLEPNVPKPSAPDTAFGLVASAVCAAARTGDTIVGFGDIDVATGYLDRLYVHWDYQGRGIATALCDALERAYLDLARERPADASLARITTHASITARPFFEYRGYHVIREQRVERRGVLLANYVMEKPVIF